MNIKAYRDIFLDSLTALYGIEEAKSFFYMLTTSYLGLSRAQIALSLHHELTSKELKLMNAAAAQLKKQLPIQYILGETEFYSLPFYVDHNVLIPRPETEELVAWICEDLKSKEQDDQLIKILDIGTGSGCIAISIAKKFPNAKVFALDLSDQAIEVASKNAVLNQVSITFINADVVDEELLFPHVFDLIVSNPPYVRTLEKQEMLPNVLDNEPDMALFVEDKDPLLFYRKITRLANNHLSQEGALYFEINQYLGEETTKLIRDMGFDDVELRKDIFTNDRMIRAKKNTKMKTLKSIAIFCGSSEGNDLKIITQARALGKQLAEEQITLVYGGAKIGIMGEVALGALEEKGSVIGVIPEFLKQKEVVHLGLSQLITVDNMHQRKLKIQELSDGFITLPGGFGTLEELFEIITWGQLGLHQKPIGLLNTNGFYNDLLSLLEHMVRNGFLKVENYELLLVDESISGLLQKMKTYKPKQVPKWLKPDRT